LFTGIIEAQGIITRVEKKGGGMELEIYAPSFGRDMKTGESISVDGVCLTLENFLRGAFITHLSKETLDRSTLGHVKPSAKVNLERAMTASDRFGGHFVTGHVDTVGRIVSKKAVGGATELTIDAGRELMPYLIEKGSVAVDGISLTVTKLTARGFSVVIIPHTELVTTLDAKGVGESVNLEADMMAKYVRRYVQEIVGPQPEGRAPSAGWARGED
jgi:riboflavin synthase